MTTDTVRRTSNRPGEITNIESVLEALKRHAPATAGEVASNTGLTQRQARDALAQLARAGRASRLGRGRYDLARSGADVPARDTGRSPWGSVRRRFESALAEYPERIWQAQDLAEQIGVNGKHAAVLLADAARRGVLVRVASGRYRLGSAADANVIGVDRWRAVAIVEGKILLQRADGTLWTATPTAISTP